jgi:hypothetical protein
MSVGTHLVATDAGLLEQELAELVPRPELSANVLVARPAGRSKGHPGHRVASVAHWPHA